MRSVNRFQIGDVHMQDACTLACIMTSSLTTVIVLITGTSKAPGEGRGRGKEGEWSGSYINHWIRIRGALEETSYFRPFRTTEILTLTIMISKLCRNPNDLLEITFALSSPLHGVLTLNWSLVMNPLLTGFPQDRVGRYRTDQLNAALEWLHLCRKRQCCGPEKISQINVRDLIHGQSGPTGTVSYSGN